MIYSQCKEYRTSNTSYELSLLIEVRQTADVMDGEFVVIIVDSRWIKDAIHLLFRTILTIKVRQKRVLFQIKWFDLKSTDQLNAAFFIVIEF